MKFARWASIRDSKNESNKGSWSLETGSGKKCMQKYLFLTIEKYLVKFKVKISIQTHSIQISNETHKHIDLPVPYSNFERVRFFIRKRYKVVNFPLI